MLCILGWVCFIKLILHKSIRVFACCVIRYLFSQWHIFLPSDEPPEKKSQLSVDAKSTHSGHSQLFKAKRLVNSGEKHSWECIWKWSTSNLKPTLNDRCGNKPHTVRKRKRSSNEHFLVMAQAFNASYERSHTHETGVD